MISDELSDHEKNGWTNILTSLPYMFLQCDKDRPDTQMCQKFYYALQNGDVMTIKVSDFKRKSLKAKKLLDKKYDFISRCYSQADKSVRNGDYANAMQSLLKIDSRVNLETIEDTIKESLPPRNYDELNDNERGALFSYVQSNL